MKTCTKCGVEKALDDFYKRSRCPDGRRPECAGCSREYARAYRENNAEKTREYQRSYHQGNKERIRSVQRVWVAANRERVREIHDRWVADNPERDLEHKRAWAEKNADHERERTRRYRARLASVPTERVDYQALREEAQECYLCRLPFSPEDQTHVDHVVPVALGGGHLRMNLAMTHQTCNLRKAAKHPAALLPLFPELDIRVVVRALT